MPYAESAGRKIHMETLLGTSVGRQQPVVYWKARNKLETQQAVLAAKPQKSREADPFDDQKGRP